jgi:hypothetical protein
MVCLTRSIAGNDSATAENWSLRVENPTIYKYPKQVIRNPDNTITEVERSLRQNGDISIIVKVKMHRDII